MKKLTSLLIILSTISLYAGIGIGYSEKGALPVELTSFTAYANGTSILLEWSTATEVNNYGFEIEKAYQRADRTEVCWEKIGFVAGSGSSISVKSYSFIDKSVKSGKCQYRLKQVDLNGAYKYSAVIETNSDCVNVFCLEQNYPNPFNPTTIISFSIPDQSNVTLKVYDVLGQLVNTIVDETKEAGTYTVDFNASYLSNGIYYYAIQTGKFSAAKKMLLLR